MAHQQLVIPAVLRFETTPCVWGILGGQFNCRRLEDKGRLQDPWIVRQSFMRLDEDSDEVLKFLNTTGVFYEGSPDLHPISLDAVKEWRTLIGKLTFEPDFRKWPTILDRFAPKKAEGTRLESTFSLGFDWSKRPPEVLLSERTTLGAMLATIHLDHARNATFRICARPYCGAPFEPQSKQPQKFCTPECAGADAQRRRRARERGESA
jgi:hypothetical protein